MSHSFAHIIRGVGIASAGTAVTAVLNVLTVKVLALTLGPAGTGFYSLIKQLGQVGITVATLNSQSAIVQAIASRPVGEARRQYLGAAAGLVIGAVVLVAAAMMLNADLLAGLIMPTAPDRFALAIRFAVFVVVLGAAATFLAGVLNGYRALKTLAAGQVAAALAGLMLALMMAGSASNDFELMLVLLLAVSQAAALSVYVVWAVKNNALHQLYPRYDVAQDRTALRHFVSISAATLVTGLATAGTMLAVRAMVARSHGLAGAGIFDAAYTISGSYIGLLLGGFGTYYMPALAATPDRAERIVFMRRVLLLVTLIAAPLLIALALLRAPVLSLLYSPEYAAAGEVLRFFIIGDFLKASAWVFAYLAIAFPNMRMLLVCDLSWNLGFILISAVSLKAGLPLAMLGMAHALLYAGYLVAFGVYANRVHGFTASGKLAVLWLFALMAVALSIA